LRKIQILIDPSHSNWILGGLFSEVAECNTEFFLKPKKISKIKSKFIFVTIANIFKLSLQKNPVLFSSITPLENFLKLSKFNSNLKILWFTHQFGKISNKTISALRKADIIFVHSKQEQDYLRQNNVSSPIIPLIGAIKPELFSRISENGEKIAFIGTPTKRKNPDVFLQFAMDNPNLQFKVLGRNWKKHEIWKVCKDLKNIEYFEIQKQINCIDLMDCSHYLMISSREGGPISLMEAVATGLVPVCTRTGIVEDFLAECGYSDQIIDFPIDFNMIKNKLSIQYSQNQKSFAAKKALEYSISNFAKKLESQIIEKLYDGNIENSVK
jgi:glycosyltransferase involved in cell wall biosynthesis